jgi:hypothetical protein
LNACIGDSLTSARERTVALPARGEVNAAARLWLLLIANLLVATSSAWTPLVPMGQAFLPLNAALVGASVAPSLLLAVWCGLGGGSRWSRLLGGLLGVAYLALWWPMQQFMWRFTRWMTYRLPVDDPVVPFSFYANQWLRTFLLGCLIFAIFTGAMLLIRRWKGELRRVDRADHQPTETRRQYSLKHLLIGITLVALVCGLSRGARTPGPWQGSAQNGLFVTAFLAVLLSVVPAALVSGPAWGRIARAFIVVFAAGAGYSFAMTRGDWGWLISAWWWILLGGALQIGLPAAILIGSLLVVRSCGYRLVPRSD